MLHSLFPIVMLQSISLSYCHVALYVFIPIAMFYYISHYSCHGAFYFSNLFYVDSISIPIVNCHSISHSIVTWRSIFFFTDLFFLFVIPICPIAFYVSSLVKLHPISHYSCHVAFYFSFQFVMLQFISHYYSYVAFYFSSQFVRLNSISHFYCHAATYFNSL